jgi:hypothetical protein
VIYKYFEIALIILVVVLTYCSIKDNLKRGIVLGLVTQASIVLSLDFFDES